MTDPTVKKPTLRRFYKDVTTQSDGTGWQLLLDGRGAKTPQKNPLVLPTQGMADAVITEWDAQTENIDFNMMPLTRIVMTVIDRAHDDVPHWKGTIENYLNTDLLCYRADEPEALVDLQDYHWTPFLQWVDVSHGVKLDLVKGIIAKPQPTASVSALNNLLDTADGHALYCMSTATEMLGSAILALALWKKYQTPEDIFIASRVDETYQVEKWGIDEEAQTREENLRSAFLTLSHYLDLCTV